MKIGVNKNKALRGLANPALAGFPPVRASARLIQADKGAASTHEDYINPTAERDFVVGDVHGESETLSAN